MEYKYEIYYLVLINLIGFLSMLIDKRRAIKHEYRISEKMLFIIALIGGSIGSLIGMNIMHHKTKHWYFKYGIPSILCIQLLILGYFLSIKRI